MASDLIMSYTHVFEAEAPPEPAAYVHDGNEFVPVVRKEFDGDEFEDRRVRVFTDGEWKDVL